MASTATGPSISFPLCGHPRRRRARVRPARRRPPAADDGAGPFLRTILILLADELERAVERLDRGLERSFDVAPPQPQLVDVALDLLEPDLRLLDEQVGASLRFADDQLGFVLRRFLDLVREPLRRQQRVAQVGLALAVLAEQRFHAREVAAQAVDLAQRVLVVVGRLGQERHDLGPVEAAQRRPEPLLAQVERADAHHAFGRLRRDRIVGRRSRLVGDGRTSGPHCSFAENGGADADERGPFLDRHLEIVAHAHRQLAQARGARCHLRPAGRAARAAARNTGAPVPGRRTTAAAASDPTSRAARQS